MASWIARAAQRLRRAGRICPAIWLRAAHRLRSLTAFQSALICVVICTLYFLLVLATVDRAGTDPSGKKDNLGDQLLIEALDGYTGGGPSSDAMSGSEADTIGGDNMQEDAAMNETTEESPMAPALLPIDSTVETDTSQFSGFGSQDFKHPLLVDMPDLLQRVRAGRPAPVRAINRLEAPWLVGQTGSCAPTSPVYLVLLIKSHPSNYANREAIRATWGRPNCWRRPVRIFFLLGADAAFGIRRGRRVLRRVRNWRAALLKENASRGDLLVREFVDHYYGNTLKLMSGVQWSVRQCQGARFTAFVDDDFFVNPYQVERQLDSLSPAVYARFLGGWVWRTSRPRRRVRRHRSKWDISFSEYPWSTYPPYVAAGALFMSQPVIQDISIAMEFTQYLRFDDIFIGLVAHKLLLTPLHMEMVRSYDSVPANSMDTATLMRLVASHGFKQPSDISSLWQRLHLSGLCQSAEPES